MEKSAKIEIMGVNSVLRLSMYPNIISINATESPSKKFAPNEKKKGVSATDRTVMIERTCKA